MAKPLSQCQRVCVRACVCACVCVSVHGGGGGDIDIYTKCSYERQTAEQVRYIANHVGIT